MIPLIRFVGLLNAAVWLGGMIFFTVIVGPAFFTSEMKALLTAPRAGAAAQLVIERYFVLQQWCAGIALVHFIFEWLYTGRFQRASLYILMAAFAVSLGGGYLLTPQMKHLHLVKYAVQTTPEQKQSAAQSFAILHGASQIANLLVLAGVLFHFWQLSSGKQTGRSGGGARYKS